MDRNQGECDSRENEVLDSMRGIIDPDLGRDIVSLGFIKNLEITESGTVRFDVELTTPACPVKEKFREACDSAVSAIAWVQSVDVKMSAQPAQKSSAQSGPGLSQVRHIVAVASCKGGVGKSTVAVNLAFAMKQRGAKVGIFDADIYGPSLPTMVKTEFKGLFQDDQERIVPVEHEGMRMMSFAFANSKQGDPAVMRGPMVTNVIKQLLTTTNWGELDYLVIDMPPGTGDIQITLSQVIPVTAAVIVTTPQDISFIDVAKGIKMFDLMKVPTVAVVENMSYFVCGNCNEKHEIFGSGAMRKLIEQYGFEQSIALPMDPEVSAQCDKGQPIVVEKPDSPISEKYRELADMVIQEISKTLFSDAPKPEVKFEAGKGIVFSVDGVGGELSTADLRRGCRCAACVNEMTGEKVLRDDEVSEDVNPDQISPMGNYAVSINWSDGHGSIYPYEMLKELASALRQD